MYSKQFNGNLIQHIDNQYYLVFDWVEGRSLKPSEITKFHSESIGEILADIHMTDFSTVGRDENGAVCSKLTD